MASLKLNAVNKVYPSGTLALYDINLETNDKEFIVAVGGEASGKSTLLRTIAGLEEVTSGEIIIGGKDVTKTDPKDRDIAMIFRSNSLYPALTVFENLAFGLKLRKAPASLIEQRVKATANILGLNDVLYRKPKVLTASQKQRVAIGRAIVREPKLYLFDEPLSGLDDKLKAEILNVIINMQARMEGSFIYCTKNVAEALTIGTRIIVLKNGIIQQIDTPANLYDYPENAYVAFYIGAPTINFLNKAEIIEEDGAVYANEGDIKLPLPENILNRFESVNDYVGKKVGVIVGIRPEDVKISAEGIAAQVNKVESDNGKIFAECTAGGNTLVVTADKEYQKGDNVKLQVNCERLYIFDGKTRLTLLSRDGGYQKTEYADANYKPLPFDREEEVKEKFRPKKDGKKKK